MRILGQPWKVAGDAYGGAIENVYVSPKDRVAVATNGHALVAVRVEVDEGEESEFVQPFLLPAAVVKAIHASGTKRFPGRFEMRGGEKAEVCWSDPKSGVLMRSPTLPADGFPDWAKVVPDPGNAVIAFNPWLLVRLAEAAGAEKESACEVELVTGPDNTKAFHVRIPRMNGNGPKVAIQMPCRMME